MTTMSDTLRGSERTPEQAIGARIRDAFEILHYNQSLVQFADTKANTLIVINSIALASASAGATNVGTTSIALVFEGI